VTGVVERLFCDNCQTYRDPHQIRLVGPPPSAVPACQSCGGVLHRERQRLTVPLTEALAKAYLYPAKPVIALSTAGAALVSAFVGFVPLVGGLLSTSIVVGFVFLVLRASAEGRDDLAVDTEIATHLSLWLAPLVRYVLTWLVAFSGALAALWFLGWPAGAPLAVALGVLGLVYLPAGMIVAAHREGCLGPLNPVPPIQVIARIPGPYFLTLAFLGVTAVVGGALVWGAARVLFGVPLVGGLLVRAVGLVPLVVMARQLGVLVDEHREEL
jgi:hypothetical protein